MEPGQRRQSITGLGAALADGTGAPEARAALFLGRDLLAPWVITPTGVALAGAAVGTLLDR